MVKEIKYNRLLIQFDNFLNGLESMILPKLSVHYKIVNHKIVRYILIKNDIKIVRIAHERIFEKFGLPMDCVESIISNKYNLIGYKIDLTYVEGN